MKLQKKYLEVFYKTVVGTEGVLTLAEGRVRDSFMKPLTEVTKQLEEDRKKIYETYCEKDKTGNPDITDDQYHFKTKDVPKVNKELIALYDEEVELPDEKRMKDIIERTQYKPKVGETEQIDFILSVI